MSPALLTVPSALDVATIDPEGENAAPVFPLLPISEADITRYRVFQRFKLLSVDEADADATVILSGAHATLEINDWPVRDATCT